MSFLSKFSLTACVVLAHAWFKMSCLHTQQLGCGGFGVLFDPTMTWEVWLDIWLVISCGHCGCKILYSWNDPCSHTFNWYALKSECHGYVSCECETVLQRDDYSFCSWRICVLAQTTALHFTSTLQGSPRDNISQKQICGLFSDQASYLMMNDIEDLQV